MTTDKQALHGETRSADVKEQLAAYSAELKLINPLTIEDLINSHRHLRSLNLERVEQWRTAMREAADKGVQAAQEAALDRGWFSRERLRSMSLGELADLLAENSDG